MITVDWNPHGFDLIDSPPKGHIFNATYYLNIILQSFLDGRTNGPGAGLMSHADNASLHTAPKILKFVRENHLGITPHPPYSLNLALSNSFLFGHVKCALDGAEFPSEGRFWPQFSQFCLTSRRTL
jgi:hypothetical protein